MCFPKQLIQTVFFIADLSIAKWATSMVDMEHKHYPVYGISPLLENILCILVTSQKKYGKVVCCIFPCSTKHNYEYLKIPLFCPVLTKLDFT